MKDLRLVLPIFLLILIVLLLTGCGGVVPSPGTTDEDVTTISGQIKMPLCCLTEDQIQDTESSVSRYSGNECDDETNLWQPAPNAEVQLREYDKCKAKYTTTTDDTGFYQFTDVKPGLYILTTYCPTDEDFFVKDVVEKSAGVALNAGIPDCDSTSLAMVIEYIGGTYCHCQFICPCFNEEYSTEHKLIKEIAESDDVNMQVNIPAIIAHEKFGTLCNEDDQGNPVNDDLVDLVCSKLNACCISPGQTEDNGDDDPCEGNEAPVINSVLLNDTPIPSSSTQILEVGTEYTLVVNASDDNVLPKPANPLTYSVNVTKGTDPSFDINLGTANSFTGTPGSDDVDEYGIILSVNDGCDSTTFEFTVIVEEDPCLNNNAPYNIDLDNKCAVVGQLYTGTVTADDDDGDTLTFAFKDGYTPPGDMAIDSETGVITWTPTEDDICVCEQIASSTVRQKSELIEVRICDLIQVTVSDPCESVDAEFCVSVQPAQYTLTMQVSPDGSGTTTPSVGDSPHTYSAGTIVNINASASTGYQFVGWTGDDVADPGSSSTTITMDSNKIITANFVADIFLGGTASIAFEDLEIDEESDYDYNDWVVDLTINTNYDGDTPNMSSISFAILPKARGAGHDHRFHILIPQDTFDEDGTYELVINGTGGSDSGIFNSGNDMDFIVIPDTRESLGGETHNHTNTKEGEGPTAETVTATLTITFNTPFYYDFSLYDPYSADSMHGEGLFFDPYLEVDTGDNNQFDSADYEIHKVDPRILTVPDSWEWPEEGISIWNVYESSVSEGNPPIFSAAWWTVAPNNCVYGDTILCGS